MMNGTPAIVPVVSSGDARTHSQSHILGWALCGITYTSLAPADARITCSECQGMLDERVTPGAQ